MFWTPSAVPELIRTTKELNDLGKGLQSKGTLVGVSLESPRTDISPKYDRLTNGGQDTILRNKTIHLGLLLN